MKLILTRIVKLILLIVVFTGAYQWGRPVPESLLFPNKDYNVPDSSVRFFADYTYLDKNGKRQTEQHIWDEIFSLIGGARHYMLFDFFLFNDFQSITPEQTRALSKELTDTIVQRIKSDGHMAVIFITDPINTVYGGVISPHEETLRTAGVLIIETNLNMLKDSNLLWSAFWRPFFSWTGNNTQGGWLPHPFQENGKKVTLRSWASLFNFKANHRKILIVDQSYTNEKKIPTEKMVTFVTSSNPHDGSGANGNVGLEIRDGIWRDVIENERRVAGMSNEDIPSFDTSNISDEDGPIAVKLLTDERIRDAVVDILNKSQRGDAFDIAMFYLSERTVINALIDAANRGVTIRLILDPNKDAFGFVKNGIPNRPVAKELKSKTGSAIDIRWCDTHGEQCHAKYFSGHTATSIFMIVGSANFTRRNIDGFNLETNIIASSNVPFTAWSDGEKYFDRLWSNKNGTFTTEYKTYEDDTMWKSWMYRMMERTGMSTF